MKDKFPQNITLPLYFLINENFKALVDSRQLSKRITELLIADLKMNEPKNDTHLKKKELELKNTKLIVKSTRIQKQLKMIEKTEKEEEKKRLEAEKPLTEEESRRIAREKYREAQMRGDV